MSVARATRDRWMERIVSQHAPGTVKEEGEKRHCFLLELKTIMLDMCCYVVYIDRSGYFVTNFYEISVSS